MNKIIPRLKFGTKGEASKDIEETGDYWVDEKAHSATLTEEGVHKVEKMLGVENLYDPQMVPVLHAVNQALAAHTLKKLDVEYVVKVGETDNLIQLPQWKDWQAIFHTVVIAVFDRPSYSLRALAAQAAGHFARYRVAESRAKQLAGLPPPAWVFIHGRRSSRSSTELRAAQVDRKQRN